MKISLNWLKEFLPGLKKFSDTEIINAIEHLGYEIENVIHVGKELEDIKFVKIVDIKPHPGADKLLLCDLTDGEKTYTVVCGAKNVYVDMIAPYIPAGGKLPNGEKIEIKKIRGIDSSGMLCSERDLMLGEDHTGIMDIKENNFLLGKSVREYFSDIVVEVSTPANRYDCLGHIGIARELAVKFFLDFRVEKIVIGGITNLPFFNLQIEDTHLCPRYIAVKIENVDNNQPLPTYIKQRLKNLGLRSINPLVDISNYVMLEVGHSVHIFDFDKIEGEKIVVRRGNNSEEILALDGKIYNLNSSVIVISDIKKPIAIAGIIGGEHTAVNENTNSIVIESAMFNRQMIRLARKRLNVNTEASYRFERGCGWDMCEYAALKTIQLILKYCCNPGARRTPVVTKFIDQKDLEYQQKLKKSLKVNLNFISTLLGVEISEKELFYIVKTLGGEILLPEKSVIENKNFIIIPPSYRQDWNYQADIAEEIARFKKYEDITDTFPNVYLLSKYEDRRTSILKNLIIQYLISCGFYQSINFSLVSEEENRVLKDAENRYISVTNPVSEEYAELRISLLPGLVKNLVRNCNNKIENITLFEFGKVYYRRDKEVKEEEQIGLICTGEHKFLSWKKEGIKFDFYFLNGIIENMFSLLGIKYKKILLKDKQERYRNEIVYNPVEYRCGDLLISFTGGINKDKFNLNLPTEVYYGEIFFENILSIYDGTKFYKELSRYPFVLRDISLTVPENLQYDELSSIIKDFSEKNAHLAEIIDTTVFDYFEKENVTTVTLRLKIQNRNKTLTNEEANQYISLLLKELASYNIKLREE